MLYRNYRIESSRLKNWDYRSKGIYFITICTKYMDPVLGYVDDGKIVLSDIGNIVDKYWCEIPNHFPLVELDEYVVMPNHIHGIIIIPSAKIFQSGKTLQCNDSSIETPLITSKNQRLSKISPKPVSISVIIRSFKSICTKNVNQKFNSDIILWQPRFYDHIIRFNKDLIRIRHYIKNNPSNWKGNKIH